MHSVRRFLLPLCQFIVGAPLVLGAATIPTNAPANLVLGQTLFTTNTSPTPATPTSLSAPSAVAVDPVSGKVFIADQVNNRVLRYPGGTALASGAAPDLVIGQSNFSSSAANQGLAAPTQTSLSAPGGVFLDGAGRLWIADTGNNRVLLFENAANLSAVPANADRVYGQPNFTANLAAPTQTAMASPTGLFLDPAGTLWVADTGSHRVLGFKNAATLANGPPADRVLGQTTFTANGAGTTQSKFFVPTGVSASATQLWVADSGNNRVLMFPNYPTTNGAPAGLVLGQTTYIASTPATSATGLTQPTSVAVSGATVWVADASNNRILNYSITATTANGAAATIVLGQPTFLTGSSGVTSQKLTLNPSVTVGPPITTPSQVTVDSTGNLWVADQLNNRALRFGATVNPTSTTVPTVTIAGPISIVTTKSSLTLGGTAASPAGIARVSYQIGAGGYFRATGTTAWSAKIPLRNGISRIQVISVGVNGKLSAPAYDKINRATGPAVAISGPQAITTTASSIIIKGTAAAPGGVARVSYRVGTGGYFRATGVNSWSATVPVKAGLSRVEFRSVGKNGAVSKAVYVNVTRN